jgi:hypothetical protein
VSAIEPITIKQRWQAITLATLLLVPAFWALLAGAVALANDDDSGVANPDAAIALGLALLPFVFVILAFVSGHRRAPGAVLRAMGLTALVGITASAIAADAVSGVVAGVGAGGVVALRMDPPSTVRLRAAAVGVAVAYTFVLARVASVLALLPAPIFPFTAIGVADHLAERRAMSSALVPGLHADGGGAAAGRDHRDRW